MDASRPPLDTALADLLHALHHRGLAIGPDDAARVAAVFRHAGDWSRERRVRALQAILGRSREERQIIRNLAPFLFVNAPDLIQEEIQETESRPAQREVAPEPNQPATREKPAAPSTGTPPPLVPPARRSHRRVFLEVVLLFCCVLLAISRWSADEKPIHIPQHQGSTQQQESTVVSSKKPASTSEPRWQSVTAANTAPCDVNPEVARLQWSLGGAALLLLTPALLVWRRLRLNRAQTHYIKKLAESEGPRGFFPVPPEAVLLPWFDTAALRDAAFLLNAPAAPMEGRWMDVGRSVEATVRQGGRPELVYHHWLQQRPICFIEDISPEMASWPGLGGRIVDALERQGGEVHHWRMRGTPTLLSRQGDPWSPLPLEQALAATPDCTVILFGNAASLDLPGWRGDLSWLGRLAEAVWLHPGEMALWQRGARFLSTLLRMVPVSETGMDRLLSNTTAEFQPPGTWRPPESRGGDAAARIALLRVMLGEAVLRWLMAGAVLDAVRLLTMTTWRGMAGLAFIGASKAAVERALTLPELKHSVNGGVALESRMRDALLREARTRDPELLTQIVSWILDWVEPEAARQPAGSLAQVEARITRARLLALDPQRNDEARRLLAALARDGVGQWLEVGVGSEERSFWPKVSLSSGRAVTRRGKLVTVFSVVLALAMGWLAMEWREVGIQTQILDKRLQFLGPEPVRYLVPDAPLRFCDRNQLADRITVTYRRNTMELSGEKDAGGATVWSLPWDSPLFAGVERPFVFTLDFDYSGQGSMTTSEKILRHGDVRRQLSELLQGWLHTPGMPLENPFFSPWIVDGVEILGKPGEKLATIPYSVTLMARGELLESVDLAGEMVQAPSQDLLRKMDELRLVAGDRLLASLGTDCWKLAEAAGKGECSVELDGKPMAFVYIPEGTFQMGSPSGEKDRDSNEGPVHEVRLDGFWLGKYEVTQGQWQAVMGSNPSEFSSCGKDCPVETVSWNDAQEFIKKLNGRSDGCTYRLPTEAEWEYAARGGTEFSRYWGDGEKEACQYANVFDLMTKKAHPDFSWSNFDCVDGYAETAPVGKFKANGFGLYDMLGNVWEWTASDYASYSDPGKNYAKPSEGGSNRVIRGGGWRNSPAGVRSAFRNYGTPGIRLNYLGLRLSRTCS